jgi:hypothetical protein
MAHSFLPGSNGLGRNDGIAVVLAQPDTAKGHRLISAGPSPPAPLPNHAALPLRDCRAASSAVRRAAAAAIL